MSNQFSYNGKVVKQGNSLCVRIPNTVKKELKIKEGNEVNITLEKTKQEYSNKHINHLLDLANKVKKLDRYGIEKKRVFITLNFRFVEVCTDESEEKQIQFIENIKKEFGKKFTDEWLEFEQIFAKEAFNTDKEGFTVLKKRYS